MRLAVASQARLDLATRPVLCARRGMIFTGRLSKSLVVYATKSEAPTALLKDAPRGVGRSRVTALRLGAEALRCS